jgi:hypothetical protein
MTAPVQLPAWVSVGRSFEERYGNENDVLWHVRGLVDGMAVCRRWRAEKRRWHYEVLHPIWFDVLKDRLHIRNGGAEQNIPEGGSHATKTTGKSVEG